MEGQYPSYESVHQTVDGWQTFRLHSNTGMPVSKNDIYSLVDIAAQPHVRTDEYLSESLELSVIDENGELTGEKELVSSGTAVLFVRSDGKTFADFYSGRKYYRLDIRREWDVIYANDIPFDQIVHSSAVAE